ncbi:MAG: helix-turn-helix transcriptional regulator [Asticcacaulis sp.]
MRQSSPPAIRSISARHNPVEDIDAISSVVDSIYQAAYDDRYWAQALDGIRQAFDASGVCIGKAGRQSGNVLASAAGADFQFAYLDYYVDHNLLWQAAERLQPGTVYSHDIPVQGGELRRSAFWNEWMAPQDFHSTLGYRLRSDRGENWLFDLERGRTQAEFDDADVRLLRVIGRTVQRALSLREQLGSLRIEHAHATGALDALSVGAILVDAQGRLQYANRLGDRIVSKADGVFRCMRGELYVRRPDCRAQWDRLLADASNTAIGQSGYVTLRTPDDAGGIVTAHVSPFVAPEGNDAGRCALILLKPVELQVHQAEHLISLFGFTAAEARVAVALGKGLQAQEVAGLYSIGLSTVRSHISSILAKAEVGHQGELLALMSQLALPTLSGFSSDDT